MAEDSDPPLLATHSSFHDYTTAHFAYRSVRVFYRPHPCAAELPPLPLLVFIHGLGGSVAQFHPLLASLAPAAPCLAVDLPGCGRSAFSQRAWAAYTPRALAELLELIISKHRENGQAVVLLGHSMGTSLCALLGSGGVVREHLAGIVAICPASAGDKKRRRISRRKLWMLRAFFWLVPGWLFDLWRRHDRRGGVESASVARFVGKGASAELKALQARFNDESKTAVWRRMAYACLPAYDSKGVQTAGMAGRAEWEAIDMPVFLVGGADDKITSPKEVDDIAAWLRGRQIEALGRGKAVADSAAPVDASSLVPQDNVGDFPLNGGDALVNGDDTPVNGGDTSVNGDDTPISGDDTPTNVDDTLTTSQNPKTTSPSSSSSSSATPLVRTLILPSPANHTLLYHPSLSRALAGHTSDFLSAHVSPRLSLGWQLQHLSREGKWDVKNLAKWKSVAPVGAPIGPPGKPPIFRACKTLREADEDHCPARFVERWADHVSDVVDIGSGTPVYDAWGLERAGVRYHKFPTVSKVPPSPEEVRAFIETIDRVRAMGAKSAAGESTTQDGAKSTTKDGGAKSTTTTDHDSNPDANVSNDNSNPPIPKTIAVHCHYGFNRTGYFLVCYLVEKCGVPVHDAIRIFAEARPNGIRHPHFLDRLYVRYPAWGDGRW